MPKTEQLHHYEVDQLSEGQPVPVDIYTEDGRRLLTAGTRLEGASFQRVQQLCLLGFCTVEPWPGSATAGGERDSEPGPAPASTADPREPDLDVSATAGARTISAQDLRPGVRLPHSLYDSRGILLLAANTTITSRFIALLRQRNLQSVSLGPAPLDPAEHSFPEQHTTLSKMLDSRLEELAREVDLPAQQAWHSTQDLQPNELRQQAAERLQDYEKTVRSLEDAAGRLLQGSGSAFRGAEDMLCAFVDLIAVDINIVPHLLALKITPGEYLYRHGLNVSLLAMAMAAQLGYSREQVLRVGMAALLHDLGMLKVNQSIRLAPRPLTPQEYQQVQVHPIHTLDLLEHAECFDDLLLLVTYQIHERCDRSGYPRGRHRQYIHPFAKIISIADVYCALTCPRPYRPPLKPYDAVEAILAQTKLGYFETAVIRALLDCIGLYPVGSTVRLNTLQEARVARAIPGRYDRPTLLLLDDRGQETSDLVELQEHDEVRVIEVLS